MLFYKPILGILGILIGALGWLVGLFLYWDGVLGVFAFGMGYL